MADESDLSPEQSSVADGVQDAVGGGQTEPTPSQAPEPAAAGSVSQPPVQTPAEQWDDIRDVARQYGLDLSHIQDSNEAARYLIQRAREQDSFSNLGRQFAPHYTQFQQYLQQAQQAQQRPQAPQQAPNPFGLPEYDPKWLDWVTTDATGTPALKPGAPPDTLYKIAQYQQAAREAQQNFLREPQRYLQPMIQQAVAPVIQQAIQGQLRQYQDHVFSTNFVAQNRGWLYHQDPQGNIIRDPVTGSYALTPEGQVFVNHLNDARSMGVRDVQTAQRYAMGQLELAYHRAQHQQAGAAQQRSTQDQQFLQQHNRRPPANHGGSIGNPQISQNPEESLADRMRRALTSGGITDAELQRDTAFV